MGELLAAAAAAAEPGYVGKGVALLLEGVDAAAAVEVDRDRFAEVLANLLENALRHTPSGGTVTLAATPADGEVELAVSDTGEGIEPAELERIFERFYRTDESRSRDRDRGGSGIGLTISRAIVEAHGGRLEADSAGPGRGSTFRATLPKARRRATSARIRAPAVTLEAKEEGASAEDRRS